MKIFIIIFLLFAYTFISAQTREIKIISHQSYRENTLGVKISQDIYPLLVVLNKYDSIWLRGNPAKPTPFYKYISITCNENDTIKTYIRVVDITKSKKKINKDWQSCPYYDTSFVLTSKDFKEGYIHFISPYDKEEKEKTFTITVATRKIIKRLRKSKPQAVYDAVTGTTTYVRELAKKAPGVQ